MSVHHSASVTSTHPCHPPWTVTDCHTVSSAWHAARHKIHTNRWRPESQRYQLCQSETNLTYVYFKNARKGKKKNVHIPLSKHNNTYLNMTSICAKTQILLNEFKTKNHLHSLHDHLKVTEGERRLQQWLAWRASSAHQWHAAGTTLTPQKQKD